MDIHNRNVLVLGGYGLVGTAVCRELMLHQPASIAVGSLRNSQAQEAVDQLKAEFEGSATQFIPVWGDILLRAEWQDGKIESHPRDAVLKDAGKRRRLVADVLEELDNDILSSSLLYQQIAGEWQHLQQPADIVIDCVNTATAVAYQNVFAVARGMESAIKEGQEIDWPTEVEKLLSSLYVPQLVRHMQILFEAMQRSGTVAYIKVGTSGTGGMGFNIPYTHGEERPSRVLLSKSAVAGAQTMLLFLMARTPGGPAIVKEVKPTAAIAWKEIDYGTIRGGGRDFLLYDCPPAMAYSVKQASNLAPRGEFGQETGEVLKSVYIDTGENGLFAAGEFTALTTLGQMEFITPEEIAGTVVLELLGSNTGRDVIAGLDATVMGPSYRAGFLREAAVNRLTELQRDHEVDSVAFEMLGPPRLSKLLFEAYLLKRVRRSLTAVITSEATSLSEEIQELLANDHPLRRQIISIGIPILLPDGERLLRGPVIKSPDAEHGWVDLGVANMARWQERLQDLQRTIAEQVAGPTGSLYDRAYPSSRRWDMDDAFDVGEVVGWLFNTEEAGRRAKR